MANPIEPYSFLFPIAAKVLEVLGSPLIQGVKLAWNMKDDLKKLRNTITFIHAVLLDADEKQYQDGNNHQLKVWMGQLRIALYEADDLLDDLLIHSLRKQSPHESLMGKVRTSISNPLIFRPKTILKIKKLREKFDAIAADRNNFGLTEIVVEKNVVMRREMTYSFGDESSFFGRGVFKEAIIGCCLLKTCVRTPFISIIGIGGIGKTTLVQTVYNDKRVIENFDLRIWVCISDTFLLAKIILDILKEIDGAAESAAYTHLEINQLQLLLRHKLQSKKYLLVLDDVWNEERDKWIELINLLTVDGVAGGSKVIVTARSELVSVALAPRACMYRLQGLPDDDCLSVLLMWAFAERKEANRFPRLVEIGREIVKKCKGNPLAVRTLGKLLYMKTEERDWVYVRDNDVWELGQGDGDIMPALKLSYHQLPSHLKQCFAYLSLFPKDFEFNEIFVVEFWRVQGLIRSEQFKTLEATGKEYLDLLAARGFFQKYRNKIFGQIYKIHDLVHDLAQSVAKPDCISTRSYRLHGSTIKVQHLSLMENGPQGDDTTGDLVLSELLELQPQLRSFLLFDETPLSHSSLNSFIETSISKFKLLRVLRLRKFSGNELPESIGSLYHLRYLDLAYSCIKSLPDLVCNLVCLEVLALAGCLELEKLPVGLGKLTRLKSLTVTTKEMCLPEKEFRCLTALQALGVYECVNMESLVSDDGMKCLSSLHTLFIGGCNSLVHLPTNGIRELQKLDNFGIDSCEKLNLQSDDQHRYSEGQRESGIRRVLFAQMPMMETLPSWLLCGANALKDIVIKGCPNLRALMPEPLLDDLKCLQRIEIFECPELKSLPIAMHRLTALKEFWVSECPQLVGRCMREDWNKISHVPDIYLDGRKVVMLQTQDRSQQMLVRDADLSGIEEDLSGSDAADLSGSEGADLSGSEGADLSGSDAADLSGSEGADLSGSEGADLSGSEGADLSGIDAADLSGCEGADLSGSDAADLSGSEGADLSGIDAADLSESHGADLFGSEGDEGETITLKRARTIIPKFKKILFFSLLVLCLGLFGKLFS